VPLPLAADGTLAPTIDPAVEKAGALALAEAKAAEAAAAAAERARKAEAEAKRREKERQEREAREEAASRSQPRTNYPIPESCEDYEGNRAIGCALALDAGYGLDQVPCLVKLWNHESGWNPKATNPSSGAYGIPQALPGNKLAEFGDDWRTNPATQIKWGLKYIKNRYKTPCGAWTFFQNNNWY
jgi:hypothetical protein